MTLPPEITARRDDRHGSRLGDVIRRLSSNSDGEIIATVRAIRRILDTCGVDIHALADHIEKPNGGALNEAEMRKLYDAGYDAGLRAAEDKHHGTMDFANVDGTPSWHRMALYCQERDGYLRKNEQEFIHDMTAHTVWREPTERQGKWLRSIYYRLGGKRS